MVSFPFSVQSLLYAQISLLFMPNYLTTNFPVWYRVPGLWYGWRGGGFVVGPHGWRGGVLGLACKNYASAWFLKIASKYFHKNLPGIKT